MDYRKMFSMRWQLLLRVQLNMVATLEFESYIDNRIYAEQVCKKCRSWRRIKEFSLIDYEEKTRKTVCHQCYDGTRADQKHKILREAYRHYLTFQQYVTDTGRDVISYSIPVDDDPDAEWVNIAISFTDLQKALKTYKDGVEVEGTVLARRKEEAFKLNVIQDMLQRDVADIMHITTVSVGQYVDQACRQLAEYYFAEDESDGTHESEVQQGDN